MKRKIEEIAVKEDKKENSRKYYLIGFSLLAVSMISFIFLIIFVSFNPIVDIASSWYLFLILGIAIIIFIIAYFILKKANKYRIEENNEQTKKMLKDFEDKFNKK